MQPTPKHPLAASRAVIKILLLSYALFPPTTILTMTILTTMLGACAPAAAPAEQEPQSDEAGAAGRSAIVSGAQPAGGSTPPYGNEGPPPDGGSTSAVTDRPLAVDVGNPKDVGPEKKGRLKLYLADQPIADTAEGLLVRIRGLELSASDGRRVTVPLTPTEIDLMQYREGTKYLLVDEPVDATGYDTVTILLDGDEPASLMLPGGGLAPVLVPSVRAAAGGIAAVGDDVALFGAIEPKPSSWLQADVTMHVDLRRQLRPVTQSMPAAWDVFGNGATYWLAPESATFASQAVGALRGLGLEGLLIQAACVYPSTPGLPIGFDTSSDCANAAGSGTIRNGTFYVGYLPPANYVLRLFLTDSLYLDVPGLIAVVPGAVTLIDLGPVAALVETLLDPVGGVLPPILPPLPPLPLPIPLPHLPF